MKEPHWTTRRFRLSATTEYTICLCFVTVMFKSAHTCVAKFVYFNEPIQKSTVTSNINLILLLELKEG